MSDNTLKLGDFGMARCQETQGCNQSSFAGSPLYTAPEIIKGSPFSFKSDIWSLGVVFYEMATLDNPFMAYFYPEVI